MESRVIQKLLWVLRFRVAMSKMSPQKIAKRVKQKGSNISRKKVLSIANGKIIKSQAVLALDSNIDAVLKAIGITEKELVSDVASVYSLDELTGSRGKHLSKELRRFVENPENIEYIKHAYYLHQINKFGDKIIEHPEII